MAHLPGNPLRIFTGSQPKSRCSMSCLIWPSRFELQELQHGIPDTFGNIAMIQRLPCPGAENKLAMTCNLTLLFHSFKYRTRHVDFTNGPGGLRSFDTTLNQGLADQDQAPVKIDILPLQSIHLAGSQGREETYGVIVQKICSDTGQEQVDLFDRKRINIGRWDL